MSKVDFKKTLKHLYAPSKKHFEIVTVPPMKFLMIDGRGNPNTAPAYQAAVETLYAVSYKAKFISKKELGHDYVVPPLEGLWWAEDVAAFTATDKDAWLWTMMIMLPDWVSAAVLTEAKAQAAKSKDLPALSLLRAAPYDERLSVQIMHIGPYDAEAPTIHALHHTFLPQNNLIEAGKHHEIYLSDPRRTAPDKLKTIIRQPVEKTECSD